MELVKEKAEVFCCGRDYDLYIALLYSFANSVEIVLILSKELARNQELAKKLLSLDNVIDIILVPDSGLHEEFFFHRGGKFNTLWNVLCLRNRIKKVYEDDFSLTKKLSEYFENNIFNLFFINTALKIFCYQNAANIRFIEEGAGIYNAKNSRLYRLLWALSLLPNKFGKGKKVFEILLSKPEEWAPDNKVKKWSTSDYEKELTIQERELILSIFSSCCVDIFKTDRPKAIVITQPLSEDGHCSEKQKIALYKKYVDKLKGKYFVFIKTHPREVTHYQDFNNETGVEVVVEPYPIDLLNLIKGLSFEVGVTVSSTGLDNLKNINEKVYISKGGIISADLFDD